MTRSPSASAKCAWPSQWTPASRPRIDGDRDRASSEIAIGRCVSACGATGTSRKRGELRREDRAAGGQRIGGRAGGRGDDDAVGAHRVGEAAVDVDRAVDHAAERAAIDHDVVERERFLATAVGALDAPPRAACAAARCSGRRASRRAWRPCRASGMSVRKPRRPWLIADQRHVVRRQLARDREHRAVAAEHDREVGAARELIDRRRVAQPGTGAIARSGLVQHDAVAARGQEGRELGERRRDARARVAADQGDAGKAGGGGGRRSHGGD